MKVEALQKMLDKRCLPQETSEKESRIHYVSIHSDNKDVEHDILLIPTS